MQRALDAAENPGTHQCTLCGLGLRPDQHPHSPHTLNPASPAKELHLTHLEVVSDVLGAMHPLADEIAAHAGRAGAGYPELGKAAGGISRQAARKRWPGAAGTQWSLYLLTGNKPPRGMAVRMFRSHDKATEAGRTAVGGNPFSDDGTIASAVINSAREAVWACYLDSGTYSPEELTLPEDLQAVPATGNAGHADWVHRWEQHIARQPWSTTGRISASWSTSSAPTSNVCDAAGQ
ncbi:hypothetical protein [Streptomyces ardesiacus]|uniref:hypothetical protein n=1 Tax=Streptomyces ardesiacus TaxID=285564 RepID=UPI002FDBADB8